MQQTYLFLQGPHGPFFRELGRRLQREGAQVLRINFNGGDWIDWPFGGVINYTGSQSDWSAFIVSFFSERHITDLIIYGDCRSLHRVAIARARAAGIRIHVFEEGYLRPDWITLEEEGVNGHSQLCGNADDLLPRVFDNRPPDDAPREGDATHQPVGSSMRWIVVYCLRYYLFKSLLTFAFRNYVRHRPYRTYQELLLWTGNILRTPLLQMRSRRRRRSLVKRQRPYYLVCLQLDSDAQMLVHSDYLSVAEFINEVLRSFARHAPSHAMLIFKKHPLDAGAIAYETLVKLEAYTLGIRQRVKFFHTGHLPSLIQESQGVVLVNSTVGTSALHHGTALMALGKAIYNLPGLTWQGHLNQFWTQATPPDPDLYRAFRRCLLDKVLINGGFYNRRGRRMALPRVVERIRTAVTEEVSGHTD